MGSTRSARRAGTYDASAVTKLELSSPMQPNQPLLTLQRLEPPPGQANTAPPWQVVRSRRVHPDHLSSRMLVRLRYPTLTRCSFVIGTDLPQLQS